jgi:hypothetical protein
MQLECIRAEQLMDFLLHSRYDEANLRTDELISSLSELLERRSPHLSEKYKNKLLTLRLQLMTISDATLKRYGRKNGLDKEQVMKVARIVVMDLREIFGAIRSVIDHGERQ